MPAVLRKEGTMNRIVLRPFLSWHKVAAEFVTSNFSGYVYLCHNFK